jgi:hypothetical protein
MKRIYLSIAAALVLLAGATSLEAQQPPPTPPTTSPQAQQKQAQQRRRGDRNKITRIEIDEAGTAVTTARDAVRVLRPQWLQPAFGRVSSSNMNEPQSGSATTVVVYIDDIRQPDLESLATVQIAHVVEMRYLDQNRAIGIRGPGHEAGVIEVITIAKKK